MKLESKSRKVPAETLLRFCFSVRSGEEVLERAGDGDGDVEPLLSFPKSHDAFLDKLPVVGVGAVGAVLILRRSGPRVESTGWLDFSELLNSFCEVLWVGIGLVSLGSRGGVALCEGFGTKLSAGLIGEDGRDVERDAALKRDPMLALGDANCQFKDNYLPVFEMLNEFTLDSHSRSLLATPFASGDSVELACIV